jgi:hypothetical protein
MVFNDQDDCVDGTLEFLNEFVDCQEYCEFDSDAAKSCLSAMEDASCEEFLIGELGEDCPKVWSCQNTDYETCLQEKYDVQPGGDTGGGGKDTGGGPPA